MICDSVFAENIYAVSEKSSNFAALKITIDNGSYFSTDTITKFLLTTIDSLLLFLLLLKWVVPSGTMKYPAAEMVAGYSFFL